MGHIWERANGERTEARASVCTYISSELRWDVPGGEHAASVSRSGCLGLPPQVQWLVCMTLCHHVVYVLYI